MARSPTGQTARALAGGVALAAHVVQLSPRSDGARYDRVELATQADGTLRLTSHQTGASLEAAWGLDDCEVELRIAPDQVAALALALVLERLTDHTTAVNDLAALCEAHGIEFRRACWT